MQYSVKWMEQFCKILCSHLPTMGPYIRRGGEGVVVAVKYHYSFHHHYFPMKKNLFYSMDNIFM